MTAFTNSNTTMERPPTLADLKQIMREMDRRFPKSERLEWVEVSPAVMFAIERQIPVSPRSDVNFDRFWGVPLQHSYGIPSGCYRLHMADGSSVMHYPSKFKIRCLSPIDCA